MPHADTMDTPRRWYQGLTGYHWLVIAVASMGWMFDTMDQWLFVQAKSLALADLMHLTPSDPDVRHAAGVATMVFIIGWATGGLFFGMVGDRLGRTKTMGLTILIYAGFTGLNGLVNTPSLFMVCRFLTGLGIGGEFAAGASLVAESLPAHARPTALGLVQAISALGNIMAALICMFVLTNPAWGWRWVFAMGIAPAFLLFLIFMFIREPEAWIQSRDRIRKGLERRNRLPVLDLFKDPILRRNTLVGVGLGTVGVIGFWGIGTWSSELFRSVLNPANDPSIRTVVERQVSWCLIAQQGGGFFGVFAYSIFSQRFGRRLAFVISLLMCSIAVPAAFNFTHSFWSAVVLFGLMGFALLSMFGGFAIYFPELFPTRLRATGTGFCYNVARYISALGPGIFGYVSGAFGIQRAALILSSVFILGLFIMPFAPETNNKALPE